jgi:hypothetical protein
MRFNPGVSWFTPYCDHDPSTDRTCIYFTQRKVRCSRTCDIEDNELAIQLHGEINSLSTDAISLELIAKYISYLCCGWGKTRHRDSIEDDELLIPLSERWKDEICKYADEPFRSRVGIIPSNTGATLRDIFTSHSTTALNTAITTHISPAASLTLDELDTAAFNDTDTALLESIASLSPLSITSPKTSTASSKIISIPSGSQPCYDLRSRDTPSSTNKSLVVPRVTVQPLRSNLEFRPHINEPGPRDSVSSKLLANLIKRDFETGSLYIFDRSCSPGYVKIGWTARNVSSRLKDWSKHGYTPNLLFKKDHVPHAQRLETLTHYELLEEWRTELKCKAAHCVRRHQEWFEVSAQRAKQVLSDWVDWMVITEPYDSKGVLKAPWNDFVKKADKNGQKITARLLLEHKHLSLKKDMTLVGDFEDLNCAANTKDQNQNQLHAPNTKDLEALEEAILDLRRIEQPIFKKEMPLFKYQSSPILIPLAENSFKGSEEGPKEQGKS